MLLHYLGKLKIQIFRRYSADTEENANKLHFKCTKNDFNSSTRVTVYSECIYVFLTKILSLLLNTMLIVDKHCSNICCDEFPLPQVDRKRKQVKEWWHGKFYLLSVWGKTCYFTHWKYQHLWMNNNVRGDKNAICLRFLPYLLQTGRKFEFLISHSSVARCLRWDGYCHMGFVANFICFPVVQKLWKSVKIWQSYREFRGWNFFWDTVYIDCKASFMTFNL